MADLATSTFDGFTARDDLTTFIANAAVTGAPFARSLTPLPTDRGGVAIPRANPTGFDWVGEGGLIPDVDMNDDADIAAVAKLAGNVTMSSEFVDDNELPIGNLLGQTVADSMGHQLDNGLLLGGGGDEPIGVLAAAPEAIGGVDFRGDVITAWGELVDAGANPETIVAFASASVIGWELARTTDDGHPIHADGAGAMLGPGIRMIPVPVLSSGVTLVADVSRLYLVLRSDFEVKFSDQAKFTTDQIVMRVKGRFAVACPTPGKTLRKITAAS